AAHVGYADARVGEDLVLGADRDLVRGLGRDVGIDRDLIAVGPCPYLVRGVGGAYHEALRVVRAWHALGIHRRVAALGVRGGRGAMIRRGLDVAGEGAVRDVERDAF